MVACERAAAVTALEERGVLAFPRHTLPGLLYPPSCIMLHPRSVRAIIYPAFQEFDLHRRAGCVRGVSPRTQY